MQTREEMVRSIVRRIFRGRDPSRCLGDELCGNELCNGSHQCCVNQKSDSQLEYILSDRSRNIFLSACPGSGKTEVVGLKAAYEFHEWGPRASGIAILNFTNNAADVIRERVHQFAGITKSGYPHFIGTMDSWLHGYLANPFGEVITRYPGKKDDKTRDRSMRVVDYDASGDWLQAFQCKTRYHSVDENTKKLRSIPLFATHLRFNFEGLKWEFRIPLAGRGRDKTDEEYFESEGFRAFAADNGWFTSGYVRSDFLETKTRFLRAGFATFHDMECMCYSLLKKQDDITKRMALRFPFIIIDECQDLSWTQLQILGLLKHAGTKLHFVGDLNQAIYEFKHVDPQKVQSFLSSEAFRTQHLTDNFRSCQEIVDLCGRIVTCQQVKGLGPRTKGPACVYTFYQTDKLADLPIWFEAHLAQREIKIDRSAILARGHPTVNALRGLQSPRTGSLLLSLSKALHLWSSGEARGRQEALEQMGRFLGSAYFKESHANKLRYYCPESVSSAMQWRIWLARVLDEILRREPDVCDLSKTWSRWAKCVKERLDEVLKRCWPLLPTTPQKSSAITNARDANIFRAPQGLASRTVVDCLTTGRPVSHQLRITTIHNVKGETLDAILLVSAPKKGQGGHWTEWLKDPLAEHARFAYVASSRPKELLAWAIPIRKEQEDDSKRLSALGFEIPPDPIERLKTT